GLRGMCGVDLEGSSFDRAEKPLRADADPFQQLARAITLVELGRRRPAIEWANAREGRGAGVTNAAPVVGLTGTGGAGKSSLTDELVLRFVHDFPDKKVAVL